MRRGSRVSLLCWWLLLWMVPMGWRSLCCPLLLLLLRRRRLLLSAAADLLLLIVILLRNGTLRTVVVVIHGFPSLRAPASQDQQFRWDGIV